MKKLLISGCSFAYGLGLELFHPEINGKDWPDRPSTWKERKPHIKQFIYDNRWGKLLADKLGLKEVNVSTPGNSNLGASLSLKEWINLNGLDDVDTIVFQLTCPVRAAALPNESEVMTGYELAMYLEKYLNTTDWKNLENNQYIMSLLDSSYNLKRNEICVEDLTRMFDEFEKRGIKCYLLEWLRQEQFGYPTSKMAPFMRTNKYRLNLFGTDETVEDWSERRRLKGGHWMQDNGYHMYFWEGHLGIEGCKELANEIYKAIK